MNSNLLQKCLDELAKDAPKLDYVRGILETLIEMEVPNTRIMSRDEQAAKMLQEGFKTTYAEPKQDEASLLDAKAKAMIDRIPKVTES